LASFTRKQAPISSTDQGGGKRRGFTSEGTAPALELQDQAQRDHGLADNRIAANFAKLRELVRSKLSGKKLTRECRIASLMPKALRLRTIQPVEIRNDKSEE
jgi:hypothetical protein